MPRAHIFSGNDEDFTTLNYTELGNVEDNCTACHSGADRIDLDHGNATCTDCHNTFWHNTRPESRVFHDANRPDLNCRTCHRDADHLVTLVFNDREFLQPRYIHNLRKLPGKVVEKYDLRYPRMRAVRDRGFSSQYSGDSEPVDLPEQTAILVDRGARGLTPRGPDWFLSNAIASVVEEDLDRAVLSLQNAFEAEPLDLLIGFSIPSLHQFRAENFDEEMLTNRSLLPELGSYLDEYLEPALRAWLVGFYDLVNLRFAEAETAFREVARVAPDSGSGWFYLGWSPLLAGNADEALTSFDRVLEVRPPDTAARTARGIAYLRKKQFRNAREELTKAINETTRRAIPYYFLGIGYAAQPDLSRSVQAFQNSLGYDPVFFEAYFALARGYRLLGAADLAARTLQQVIQARPDHFFAHVELANLYKYQSDSSGFRYRTFLESTLQTTSGMDRQSLLAILRENEREYRNLALSEYASGLRVQPLSQPVMRQVAEIYRKAARLDEALEIFLWLEERQPEFWLNHYRIGTILLEMGRTPEAVKTLETAVRLAPARGDSHLALGVAYMKADRMRRAADTFLKGTTYEPFNPALYINLGAALAQMGQLEAAKGHFHRAIELGTFPLPRTYLAYTNLGLIHLRQDNADEALQSFENALYIYPDYEVALRMKRATESMSLETVEQENFVFNEMLELFGEITTVAFESE